ncbi:chromodomain-helicase-DNA-binding protein 7 isoform X2 [Mastacembelus armatus]|uniref:chromodomain-helicase-DNA-binding protein 7 isoform X2 n=1 Tax=Mastacembelus armatus TaxID=205130 RepID=UPI000E46476E|nr:chromodomain-helicase-DNA-binding protein 7 isoform X2 [Mastacembelus armatus]
MADPGMLSLFGDDAGLFSDGLDGLGDCFSQQPAPGQSNPLAQQTNPSLNHEHQGNRGYHQGMIHSAGPAPGQSKMGQMYDHGPFTSYDQSGTPGGRMMAQNGPSQGPPNVNAAMNGMASHYHNNPANSSTPHHGYPGDAGGGGGGGVWGQQQQQQQQQQQGRSAYQQHATQPGGGPNQMGGYQMSQGNYGGLQGPSTPSAAGINQHYPPQSMAPPPAQDPSHYMGRVGMGGTQMRHPQPQTQPQGYPNMGHRPRYPHSPSRQPPHTHQHQQGMAGFGGGQYPGYQAQYGAIGPGMGQGANANVRANTSQTMGPGQLGQRFNQESGSAAGQQGQRYPLGPAHQQQPLQGHPAPLQQQTGQQGQPMHPLNHPQHPQNLTQTQPQSHLAPPAQGSYPSPSSMSPMRVLGTPTPPPPQGRPPSAGLVGAPEVAGYTSLQSPPSAMPHPQRTPQTTLSAPLPQHQQPHNLPTTAGQMYPGTGPQRGPQMGPNRPQQQQGSHEAPVSQGGDQHLLQTQQQASRSGQPLQPAPMTFQGPPVSQNGALAPNQGITVSAQTQHTHLPPHHHLQSTPPQPNQASNPWAALPPTSHPLSSPPLTPQKVPHVQHSPTDPLSDASVMVPDRPAVGAGAPGQPISTEQTSNQETKPKKKKKKKAKTVHGKEEEGGKKAVRGKGGVEVEEDVKSEFPASGNDTGERITSTGIVEGCSPPVEEKKKRKKKPKEKTEGKEPKEPKTPRTPKTPKTPKEPKEKKAKSSTPKTKTPKKTSSKKVELEGGTSAAKKDSKRKRESSVSDDVEVKSPTSSPPEEEEDDGVQKRRSSRQVKRKRYTEDLEFRISDDDDSGEDSSAPKSPSSSSQQQDVAEAEGPVVEKIMGLRTSKKQLESGEEVEVEEFYVKFKGFSYLHCRWAELEELEKDKRIHQKVKRFKAKQQLNTFITEMDDEPFNPDYVEVDRVLDISESTDENGETVTLYLVKWCSLPYEDSTWELKADIDQSKIEEYERITARTPNTKRVDRPPAADWKRLESSREYRNGNALREYQLEGLNWLTFNWYNSRNCILADEMGLGKTIQSITFLNEIYMKGIEGPFLVIAPLSTIPNWEREFRTWTELNAVVYHGSQASRKTIQAYEMYYRDTQGKIIKGVYRFHAVITTFEMILADCPELRSIPWRCVVIDEAHRLKNRNCKLLEGLKMMDMEHKVLLTGTPLQNTVEELFSLLNFLEPERFLSEQTFMTEFGDLKTEEQVQKLQGILKPMMLRRLKEDVEKNLAPKEETIIEVELTNIQKKYYRAILEKNFSFLSKGGAGGGGGGGASVPNLLNTMMELRKCCNHPYLINGAEEKIIEEFKDSHGGGADMPDMALQAMIQAAGKLVLIDKLLPKLKAGGHRVLVFSQMVRCLDILEDYLIQKRYPYERIDGRVRGNLRQAAIDRFSRPDSDRFVFLLCTRAGGLGINLTAADTCIIFDSDWNPQNDLQAQARCHRIGQSKAVKIYRLITRNSYEREMFDKASLKLGLDKAVLQSMSGRENANSGVQQLSKKEIEDLLRKGAYGALMDEEDEGSKFCEEDIDQILQRRTHTITIESEGKGSTFAKASFVATGNRTDISLEDPDFWQKWAKKAELDLDAISGRNTLVIDTPRVRKQTRHYSSVKEDEMLEFSELESDEDEPSKPSSKPRRPQEKTQGYPRSECFRVEKNLLVYGWGRWSDILAHGRFKRPLKEADVETICRALLAYCLLHYRGDENIKSFIWDLITPSEDGTTKTLSNHSGLSTPVPRGRKGKKGKPPAPPPQTPRADWLASCNPDHLLQEDSYKRHLKHHCNKVLLRVRMLYYLRQEVIGTQAKHILEGAESSDLDIWIPQPFHAEVPADWWDSEADKSLLIGVFKHGYEKYNSMRADPALCFLERVGMPDAKAIAAEQRGSDMMADGAEGEDEDPEYKPLRMPFKDDMDDFTNSPLDDKDDTVEGEIEGKSGENGQSTSALGSSERLYWPAASALTARLRRLITAYQRSNRREQLRQEALNRPDGRRRRRREFLPSISMVTETGGTPYIQDGAAMFLSEGSPYLVKGSPYFAKSGQFIPESSPVMNSSSLLSDGAVYYKERRQRWTRREEADFYRVVSTFGVVFDTQRQKFDWTQFRAFARLDKKTDESLEKYYYSFIAMCKRVCRMQVKTDTELPDPTLIIDPITEERASRTLYRIELLRRIREQVLPHPMLSERLKLCQPSPDLPEWWECGRHDRDLLLGASKHGVSRTDYHILNDPTLAFLEAHQRFTSQRGTSTNMGAQGEITKAGMGEAESSPAPLLTPAELASVAGATKIADHVAKEDEREGMEVKTEEGKAETEVKMETEEGNANDIPLTKTEISEEQKEHGEVGGGKGIGMPTASPLKEVKEEIQPKVEKEELEEESGKVGRADNTDKNMTEDKKRLGLVDSLSEQEETNTELSEHTGSPKAQPDHKTVDVEDRVETESPESPTAPKSSDPEKSPEEEEEERMDEDDKSEKSSQAEVSAASEQKNFDEESIASLSTSARDETRDGFCPDDLQETSVLQALQDRTYAFSFWPKDRVMINRMDNICEAVLKGKWPVNKRHIFDFPSNLLPGHGSMVTTAAVPTVTESPLTRRSLAELTMAGIHTPYSRSEDKTLSPQVHEDSLGLTVPRRRRRRRKIEIEAERAAKRRNLMEMVAQLRESHAAVESQSQAIDLTKGIHHSKASPSLAGFSSALVTSPSLKTQLELLQQAPPPQQRANGSLETDLPIMRRRRGRRKNVEGLELLFMGNKRAGGDDADGAKVEGVQDAAQRARTVPEQSPSARSVASGSLEDEEVALSNKELGEWLRQHPTYTMDMAGFTPKSEELLLSQFSKPKQKRHRCRNPNKIDINTLTGDERVPVVNRRNGRKMGGAMAPPMKELPRWLLENPEFSIAPDWTDIVKQSGFLPEAMFDRLLTGPVVREEGVRRRGRRPKSEIAKAAAAAQATAAAQAAQASLASAASSAGGINPLLLNSLFGGMDLSSLQSLQSLQLAAGLMAFPSHSDPKQAAASAAAASMLPLMLPGMGGLPNMATALPNMFSLGGLFGGNLTTAAPAASNPVASASGNTNGTVEGEGGESDERKIAGEEKDEREDCEAGEEEEDGAERNEDGPKKAKKMMEKETEEATEKTEKLGNDVTAAPPITAADSLAEASINGDAATLLAAAGMSANSLAFNPFLLSTMAPGLLYPSMFLPPGLAGLSLPGFPTATTLAELQSAMAGALGGNAMTTNPTRDEEQEEKKVLKDGGGECVLAQEEEGGVQEETRGEADGVALEEGGMGGEEEEAVVSPQKDHSD